LFLRKPYNKQNQTGEFKTLEYKGSKFSQGEYFISCCSVYKQLPTVHRIELKPPKNVLTILRSSL